MEIRELSMMTAFAIIVIILVSGGARAYFKHKFDVSEHMDDVQRALLKNQRAKQRLHNAQHLSHHS